MAVGTTMAILGGIGMATNFLGGLFGGKAKKTAAQIQAEAAAAAGRHVEDTVASTNPAVLQAAKDAGGNLIATAGTAADDATRIANEGAANVTGAVTNANKLLDPYTQAGSTAADVLNAGIAPGGDFNKVPTQADLQMDPGYEWRQKQAEQALERSAAAHGGVNGGGFQRDLNREIQGAASQEYQAAFNRFQTSTQNRFANVYGVAGLGQQAATTQGGRMVQGSEFNADQLNNTSRFGGTLRTGATQTAGGWDIDATNLTTGRTNEGSRIAGDYTVQGANAKAAGTVAASDSLWNGIGGAVNTGFDVLSMGRQRNYIDPSYLKNPLPPPPPPEFNYAAMLPPPPTVNYFARP